MTNVSKAGIAFLTGILIARGLGPENYGVFAFLLASFSAIKQLLDMGTSSAFYTFISKQNKAKLFFLYYFSWVLMQFTIGLAFISILAPDEWIDSIWRGESRERVVLAFIAVFFQQHIWQIISQVGESQRLTVRVQLLNLIIAVCHFSLICILYMYSSLSLEYIYYFILVEFIGAIFIAYKLFPISYVEGNVSLKGVLIEFKRFCLPLIPYAWVSMILGFTDTWLLQKFGGAVEQAYFAVASQFAAVSLIVTASILKILWKEVAEANEQNDMARVYVLYRLSNKILFFVGALISGFIIPWSEEIVIVMLGTEYIGASFVLALMFLYPIHQSLGQVNGTMFFALERTRPYVLIGICSMIVSTCFAYFMIASTDAAIPGLGLASKGLALKMVIIQVITVNFSIWYLSKEMGWRFEWVYQLSNTVLLMALGCLAHYLIGYVLGGDLSTLFRLASALVLYLLMVLFVVYCVPSVVGLDRVVLRRNIEKISAIIRKKVRAV